MRQMMSFRNAWSLLFMVFLTGQVILAGCTQPGCRDGELEGKVQIGPFCPVEPCTSSPDEIYRSYHIRIFQAGSTRLIADVPLSEDGSYHASLCEGVYAVSLEPAGMWSDPDLPAPVTIREGRVTLLDINVDTGIR